MSFNSSKINNKIAIVAPASPLAEERFMLGTKNLEERGFVVTAFGNQCQESCPEEALFCADLDTERVAALYDAFENAAIIWAAKGGYGAMELLPLLDFSKLETKDKVFVGFSDLTALHAALYKEKGNELMLIHGPTLESGWSKEKSDEEAKKSVDLVLDIIDGRTKELFSGLPLSSIGEVDAPVEAEILGGNLSMIVALLGTPWGFMLDGKILFFEEVGEKPYRIHRLLTQLKIAGKLDGIQGVLIGHLTACDHPQGIGASAEESILNVLKPFKIPIFKGAPSGHIPQNYPLPLGRKVRLSKEGCVLL